MDPLSSRASALIPAPFRGGNLPMAAKASHGGHWRRARPAAWWPRAAARWTARVFQAAWSWGTFGIAGTRRLGADIALPGAPRGPRSVLHGAAEIGLRRGGFGAGHLCAPVEPPG